MNNILLKPIVLIFLFFSSFSWAQFNTIIPIQAQKSDNHEVLEMAEKEMSSIQKREKNVWKNLFSSNTKTDSKTQTEDSTKSLTSQIDSLKTVLKNQQIKEQKREEKRKNDSLVLRIKELEASQHKLNFQKTKYDFIYRESVEKAQILNSKIVMPLLGKISVTSPFGIRTHPISGTKKLHNGIDLKANYENVYAVLDGIVTATGWDSKGGGNFIKINHYNRFKTSYLHLSEIYYKVGEQVKAGFIIAKSGNSGNSTGPHLHFGVKEFGKSINPIHFLNDLKKAKNLIANYYEH